MTSPEEFCWCGKWIKKEPCPRHKGVPKVVKISSPKFRGDSKFWTENVGGFDSK